MRASLSLPLVLLAASQAIAVKFDLHAAHHPQPKCIWNTAMVDTLVVITANVEPGLNQKIDMEVLDGSSHKNIYQTKKNIQSETRMAITTHADAELGVCFKNTLDANIPEHQAHKFSRAIDLDVDIGADAVDYNAIAKQESLSGLEVEMRKLEGVVKEIVDELNYLKQRERKMRDTNESTNERVKFFSLLTVATLVSLGVWQIVYLRSYFKRKLLI
ncbi:uncharacterized protein L969DRAFT_94085 [Mixia osmundae IAM 14324]|uniref:GOLD domain-containing protein n=1 Tax=Mixia osmundae (strain CBS 9802 / IAM 14324 / JCM 22182 / KY 12970) TaxID=764103 RepID=G7E917_MIXOS|nr:uncharacterized protein L969DRAFT_94085 [Mixia osmundae IAM 14324]KEI40271.1 hypothetical protein L969DRAFT_94085 [Mixia osmundae IAM 14324]GAA99635.1 hypothetical protein E5Q_06336 [Mixia osmundae IAM 14324]